MNEEQAKQILKQEGPPVSIVDHIEALHIAIQVIGDNASMKEIWQWANNEEKK